MKKLQKIHRLLSDANYDISRLKNHGFSKVYGREDVLINRNLGIVVKEPYLSGRQPHKNLIAPMIRIDKKKNCPIFIQCLVRMSNLEKALNILEGKVPSCCDLHSGNVGWYRNKAVLIDW